jgi:predicted phosphodiesterase
VPSLSISDKLESLTQAVETGIVPPARSKTKEGQWKPGIEWSGNDGFVTTPIMPAEEQPDWSEVLSVFELDPAQFDVVEPVLFNAWNAMGPEGSVQLMRQWKAKVIRKIDRAHDFSDLIDEIKRHKPNRKKKIEKGNASLVVVLSDWQIGKPDGDGIKGTVSRILEKIDMVGARYRDMTKIGHKIDEIIVVGLGDLVEGVEGNYAMQTFAVEADRREQVKIARRLVRDAIIEWSKLVSSVRVVAVAGNHGEHRRAGKAFTTLADSDDLAIFEQVAEIFASNKEAYGHVRFAIPKGDLSMTLEAHGHILGVTHGHSAKMGSGSSEMKLRRWLEKQSLGRQPIGDCDILITGHYHSFRMADWGGITWVQAPALDGGSEWWTAQSGDRSKSGMLTFLLTQSGLRDLEVV